MLVRIFYSDLGLNQSECELGIIKSASHALMKAYAAVSIIVREVSISRLREADQAMAGYDQSYDGTLYPSLDFIRNVTWSRAINGPSSP